MLVRIFNSIITPFSIVTTEQGLLKRKKKENELACKMNIPQMCIRNEETTTYLIYELVQGMLK